MYLCKIRHPLSLPFSIRILKDSDQISIYESQICPIRVLHMSWVNISSFSFYTTDSKLLYQFSFAETKTEWIGSIVYVKRKCKQNTYKRIVKYNLDITFVLFISNNKHEYFFI